MRVLSRSHSAANRARVVQANLRLEILESRLALAVITVNAAGNPHAIDPNIYGTAFATSTQLDDLNLPLNRNGGNSSDTYSYQQDATNRGSDWYFESIASGLGNGQGMDDWIDDTFAGGASPSITLNLFDWAARNAASSSLGSFPVNVYGPQQSVDPWNTNLGNGIRTNGTAISGNDPNITYVPNSPAFEQVWIQHLIDRYGSAQNGGIGYYTLGNEPGLWNSTHRDIHPNGNTLVELRDRVIAYASMVKSLDPDAKMLGFEEWGWTNYFVSGADAAASNWGATYNGLDAQAWLLDQMRQHEQSSGTRLVDYFTLHYYPQGGQFSDDVSTNMALLRNRSTRSLWDPNYVDESWIASTGIDGGKVDLLNRMEEWVDTYYPGTRLGITEYNWGAEGNMNGATTQADIWGIFGREGLDLANRWTTPATNSPTYLAMKMYRNYDGSDSTFGETSIETGVANPDQVSAFSSIRAADGALTVMVVNKNLYSAANPTATTPITVNLSNFAAAGTAQRWQLAAVNPANQNAASILHLGDVTVTGNSLTVNVPMESVTLFVLSPASSAPAAPTGVSATPGDHRVTLSWNASGGATSYRVYRGTSSGGETLLQSGVTGTGFIDTAALNGTTYYYTVSAVNGSGESPQSAEVSAAPQLTAPANLAASVISASQINLTWSDNTAHETQYILEWATNSAFTTGFGSAVLGANATTHSVTGLTASTTYWFRTRAADAISTSPDSNVVSATTFSGGTAGTGLAATYFNNTNFTGTSVSRTDAIVNFNWGNGSPAAGITGNTFSARWLGQVRAIETGNYRFQTRTDEGVRLWVNGRLLIDNWRPHSLTTNTSATIRLVAGQRYDLRMQYYDNTGAAVARLLWQRPGQTSFAAIPESQLSLPGSGLDATYYDNLDFTGATVNRVDTTVNFDWATGSPAAAIGPDSFSARWTGQIQASETGTYTFRTYSDDGVRVRINGQLIIDNWTDHAPTYNTGTIVLQAGERYDIVVEYYDNTGAALMTLEWLRPGWTAYAVVPKGSLFST